MQHLPIELLCLICDELSDAPTALSRLGRSARVLVAPAQKLLFRSVDLEGSSMRVVRGWCTAVTRKRKDAASLAPLVRSLVLEFPEIEQFAPDDMGKVAAALKSCTNFKTLRLLRASGFDVDRFQLTAPALRPFVEAQTHLRIFHGDDGGAALPKNLIGHASGSWSGFHTSHERCSLQRVEIARPADIPRVRCCAQSLTTLNILKRYDSGTGPYASLVAVAENAPNLVHLAIMECHRARLGRRWRDRAPQQAIHDLHQLETFTYILRNIALFYVADDTQTHREYISEDEDDMRAMTRATIEACPTLYRVVAGIDDKNKVQSVYTATRDGLGQVRVRSAREAINFNALSMFWAPV
ncbi:hypothetical protein MKEN_00744600 [Mycena kentingensis (nom. inval.)]|nr:hypothetical protein MKEN_00744600 [Mycena kentingensis (nom. inval.)]